MSLCCRPAPSIPVPAPQDLGNCVRGGGGSGVVATGMLVMTKNASWRRQPEAHWAEWDREWEREDVLVLGPAVEVGT